MRKSILILAFIALMMAVATSCSNERVKTPVEKLHSFSK